MEADMRAAQDAVPKYEDGDMDDPPSREDLRGTTRKVLALNDIADNRQLRNSPQRTVTTETRARARPEDERRTTTSWSRGSTWANFTPAQPGTEDPSSASDISWKDKWQGHSSRGAVDNPPWKQ